MVKNNCFSLSHPVKTSVILFGMLCFLEMFPAAIEPEHAAVQTQTVVIKHSEDSSGPGHTIYFKDDRNQDVAKDLFLFGMGAGRLRYLPIQNITVIVAFQPDIETPEKEVNRRTFSADEVQRLQLITVDNQGGIKSLLFPLAAQEIPRAIEPEHAAVQTQEVTIKDSAGLIGPRYVMYFKDLCGNNVIASLYRPIGGSTIVYLPIKNIRVSLALQFPQILNREVNRRTFSADEVQRLQLIAIDGNGSIEPVLSPLAAQKIPRAIDPEPAAVAPGPVSYISYFDAIIKKGDLEGLRALLPAVKQEGNIDELCAGRKTALGELVIRYRNVLEMINELVANDASLFKVDGTGKTPLEHAGDQRANLLKSIVIPGECAVCFQPKQRMLAPCGHPICVECYKVLLQRTGECPTCRTSFPHQ